MQARYEVFATSEGRETLEHAVAGRDQARAAAAALLDRGAEQARVVEIKSLWTGREYEKEIFSAKRNGSAEPPVNLPGAVDEAPICQSADDLYALPARLAIGQVIRRYLDHHGLTVTEILHSARELRRLADADRLVTGAIGRIAARQVELYGGDLDQRTGQLTAWLDSVAARARALDKEGPAAREAERLYAGRLGIARRLVTRRSLAAKLDELLGWLDESPPDEVVSLIDGFVADILTSGRLIRETLGARTNLAEALEALFDLRAGRLDTTRPGTEPLTGTLNRALAAHKLPETQAVLTEHIRRAVAGAQRLTKEADEPTAEEAAFKHLIERAMGPDGPIGGAGMAAALIERYGRLRGKPAASAVPFAIRGIGGCFAGAWDEIVFLTTLLASPLAETHRPTILAALDGCLAECGSLDQAMWRVRDPAERLARVHAFHRLIAGLDLPRPDKARIARWVEGCLVPAS